MRRRGLVDKFRHEQAGRMIDGGMEAKTIAYLLGFKDFGSFRCAFCKWTGEAPNHWRRRLFDEVAPLSPKSVDDDELILKLGAVREAFRQTAH